MRTLHALLAFMAPVLFRVDDLAQVRGTDPPVLCIVVVEIRAGRVRVAYRDAHGWVMRRWMLPSALVQCTAQYAATGIPPELEALRARRPSS